MFFCLPVLAPPPCLVLFLGVSLQGTTVAELFRLMCPTSHNGRNKEEGLVIRFDCAYPPNTAYVA